MNGKDDRRDEARLDQAERLDGEAGREADVLELLLSSRSDERARTARILELCRDPKSAAQLASMRSLVQRSRSLDRRDEWTQARERKLVDGVLARTTRLDPGWRGDLRLVVDFVRERVSSSRQLRTAAALLFIHCFVVLPAVAWVMLRPARIEPHFFTGIVPPPEVPPDAEQETVELELPEGFEADLLETRRLDAQENTRRRAHFLLLSKTGLPAWRSAPADEPAPSAVLFRERLRLQSGGGTGYGLDELDALAKTSAERSLLALLALDRGLVLGRPAELGPLLNELALAEADGTADALALHVLARARCQGDWPGPPPAGSAAGSAWTESVLPAGEAEERALRELFGAELEILRGW